MGCGAGYPEKSCPFNAEGLGAFATRQTCGRCVHFTPPKHILSWCQLWDRDKVLCMKPKSACTGCPEKNDRGPGRPAGEGAVDWKDPKSVNKYQAELMAKRRAEGKDINKPMPASYHRNYYKENRQRILERRRARRQEKGE